MGKVASFTRKKNGYFIHTTLYLMVDYIDPTNAKYINVEFVGRGVPSPTFILNSYLACIALKYANFCRGKDTPIYAILIFLSHQ